MTQSARPGNLFPGFLVLFLSVAFSLPAPAHALRPGSGLEDPDSDGPLESPIRVALGEALGGPAAGMEEEFSEGALEGVVRELISGQNAAAAVEKIFGWIGQPLQEALSPQPGYLAELREKVGAGEGWKDLALKDLITGSQPETKDIARVVDWIDTYLSSDGTRYLQAFLQDARRLIDRLEAVGRAYQQAEIIFTALQGPGVSIAQQPALGQQLEEWIRLSDRYDAELTGLIDDLTFIESRLLSAKLMGMGDIPALAEKYAKGLDPADPQTQRFQEQVARLRQLHQEADGISGEVESLALADQIDGVEQRREDAHDRYQQLAAGMEEARELGKPGALKGVLRRTYEVIEVWEELLPGPGFVQVHRERTEKRELVGVPAGGWLIPERALETPGAMAVYLYTGLAAEGPFGPGESAYGILAWDGKGNFWFADPSPREGGEERVIPFDSRGEFSLGRYGLTPPGLTETVDDRDLPGRLGVRGLPAYISREQVLFRFQKGVGLFIHERGRTKGMAFLPKVEMEQLGDAAGVGPRSAESLPAGPDFRQLLAVPMAQSVNRLIHSIEGALAAKSFIFRSKGLFRRLDNENISRKDAAFLLQELRALQADMEKARADLGEALHGRIGEVERRIPSIHKWIGGHHTFQGNAKVLFGRVERFLRGQDRTIFYAMIHRSLLQLEQQVWAATEDSRRIEGLQGQAPAPADDLPIVAENLKMIGTALENANSAVLGGSETMLGTLFLYGSVDEEGRLIYLGHEKLDDAAGKQVTLQGYVASLPGTMPALDLSGIAGQPENLARAMLLYSGPQRQPAAAPPAGAVPAVAQNSTDALRDPHGVFTGPLRDVADVLKGLFQSEMLEGGSAVGGEVVRIIVTDPIKNVTSEIEVRPGADGPIDTVIDLGKLVERQPARFERNGSLLRVTVLPAGMEEDVLVSVKPLDDNFWDRYGARLTPDHVRQIEQFSRQKGGEVEVTAIRGDAAVRFRLYADPTLAQVADRMLEDEQNQVGQVLFDVSDKLRALSPRQFQQPGLRLVDDMLDEYDASGSDLRTERVTIKQMQQLKPFTWIALSHNRNLKVEHILNQRVLTLTVKDDRGTLHFLFA